MDKNKTKEIFNMLPDEKKKILLDSLGIDKNDGSLKHEQIDIAIIGLSGKYPQSENHFEFWNNLKTGKNLIEEVPGKRWDHGKYYDPEIKKKFVPFKTCCKYGSFLKDYDSFDSTFFEIKDEDVFFMDPQERLALETVWSCIEDAGYKPADLGREVGVFSGLTYSEYQKMIPLVIHPYMLNNRITYFFDFKGPAITTDAGCSSSLAAIHLACQSLMKKECKSALVIGANLILHPDHYTSASPMLSAKSEPVSNPFGVDDGWLPSEGVVSVLLKPLKDAIEMKDNIYAIIKSTHLCQEGKTSWFTAFNPQEISKLISENFIKSGINPETIGYVEAAANGTSLGDAIEFEGLTNAFRKFTDKKNYCSIGTVKANVGHGESVSALLQLTKVLYQFKSKKIIPVINLNQINDNINPDDSPFYFPEEVHEWKPQSVELNGKIFQLPRRATVSSFGAGGNMGHIILEEYISGEIKQDVFENYFIPVSSKSKKQLRSTIIGLIKYFEEYNYSDSGWQKDCSLINIMYTLCTGRTDFNEKVVFIARDIESLLGYFKKFINNENDHNIIYEIPEEISTGIDSIKHMQERHDWIDLSKLWIKGIEILWKDFFNKFNVNRISLPGFCFDKKIHPLKITYENDLLISDYNESSKKNMEENISINTDKKIKTKIKSGVNDNLIKLFKEIFSGVINVPVDRIDISTPIENYGFDSILVLSLSNKLEKYFSRVPKTLFFECRTINDVINYFLINYPDDAKKILSSCFPDDNTGSNQENDSKSSMKMKNIFLRKNGNKNKDIAVIGIAGRYPEACNLSEFWKNLSSGKNSITEIPRDRWAWEDFYDNDIDESIRSFKSYSKWGGFIDDVDKFDPLFFNISPREAEIMDPQERLFLEVVWELLEDAGYTRRHIKTRMNNNVGVYVGATWQEYQLIAAANNAIVSSSSCNISNRVSYFFDFQGSSLTVDTACSSSFTAIHLACSNLRQGIESMAIAGGVNLSLHPNKYMMLSQAKFLSTKGLCESFGEGGDGYVPGEGIGAVLLKPLDDAINDGDHIYGVIKSTAINHGGKSNGFTIPNPLAQSVVIEQAIIESGIDPSAISYIEAHGTGTSLGDPIEISGITNAFRKFTDRNKFCRIGSVKSNIGHCESASGIAGLTKVLLQFKHKKLVPSIHSERINSNIDLNATPFVVQQKLEDWKQPLIDIDGEMKKLPRIAGISAFGAGGSNAHIIVEEYDMPQSNNEDITDNIYLIVLSAKNKDRLVEKSKELHRFLTENEFTGSNLMDISYTLQTGRENMDERLAFTASSLADLLDKLEKYYGGSGFTGILEGNSKDKNKSNEISFSENDVKDIVSKCIDEKKYDDILDMWIRGFIIDWNILYAGKKPRKISLPSYPFIKNRYWIEKRMIDHAVKDNTKDEVRKTFVQNIGNLKKNGENFTGDILFMPVWDELKNVNLKEYEIRKKTMIITDNGEAAEYFVDADSVIVMSQNNANEAGKYFSKKDIEKIIFLFDDGKEDLFDGSLIKKQSLGVLYLFNIIKQLIGCGYGDKKLDLLFITVNALQVNKNEKANPAHSSIHGLASSLAKEYFYWKINILDIKNLSDINSIDLNAIPINKNGETTAFRGEKYYYQKLIPCNYRKSGDSIYKDNGIYVVIGGAGGLGEIWSRYMVDKYNAQIIWIGRRGIDENIRKKISKISNQGKNVEYISANAADTLSLKKTYDVIKEKYRHIDGVIHSAIVLSDHSIANMNESDFISVLSAKVDISVNIADIFRNEYPDFMLFFSSMQSFARTPGQSNYASGCVFKDEYAHQLGNNLKCRIKTINWGFWGNAGVVSSKEYRDRMTLAGIDSIESEKAMEILEYLLSGPFNQLGFIRTLRPGVVDNLDLTETMEYLPYEKNSYFHEIEKKLSENKNKINTDKIDVVRSQNEMDRILASILFYELNRSLNTGKTFHIEEWMKKFKGINRKWLEESAVILEKFGFIRKKGNSFTVIDDKIMANAWDEWNMLKQTWSNDSIFNSRAHLAENTLKSLIDIIIGKKTATDVIFSGLSMDMVKNVYQNNSVSDYYNVLVSNAVEAYICEAVKSENKKIRIFEIGAGTGSTSSMIFEKINPYKDFIGEYYYTDISEAFLNIAKKEYKDKYDFIKYSKFDAENSPVEQGIDYGTFDIVIASNVLHATKNIINTVRNAKSLLKNRGILILNELSCKSVFAHLTFGLLDGWWLYEDEKIRIKGSPGLLPETWKEILVNEGLDNICFPAEENHDLGQQVILAESNGEVRLQGKRLNDNLYEKIKETGSEFKVEKKIQFDSNHDESLIEDQVKNIIIESVSEVLKIDRKTIGNEDSFADFGLDSILGIHFIKKINDSLKTDLSTTSLFDYGSINRLSRHIFTNYKDIIFDDLKTTCQNDINPDMDNIGNSKSKGSVLNPPFQKVKVKNDLKYSYVYEPIAVIGISGIFPKSDNPEMLWKHIAGGDDLIEEVKRWDLKNIYSGMDDPKLKYCYNGGFLDNIGGFDPLFFNISGLEATYMDPQQRIFLQESWKALEDAGYAGKAIKGKKCGVYVGCHAGDYKDLFEDDVPALVMWGNASAVLPARIAYCLDLKGPAISVDTACSSSLVAVHLACQGLWSGENEMAIAGGIFLQCTPNFYISGTKAGMLSKGGKCYTFDQRADGFVPGEGAGVVVLKRLKDAIKDGDNIYCVIRGSGINQDGTSNGITAPSAISQEQLEYDVYDKFGINPANIQMVEAHGTATKLGDPIEFEAITRAFRRFTDKKDYCAIGSVKTNLGHTSAAAGIIGMIKIILSIKYKKIPPSLNYKSWNDNIRYSDTPFYVNTGLKDWNSDDNSKRCAALSSFGVSGTNAHIVIEESGLNNGSTPVNPAYIIALSAHKPDCLKRLVEKFLEFCYENPDTNYGNMSFTMFFGRKHMNHRLAFIARNNNELICLLKNRLDGKEDVNIFVSDMKTGKEKISLKRFGDYCINNCRNSIDEKVYMENLSSIADLYVQGYDLNYEDLFINENYQRISLPSYPFAGESFWVPEKKEIPKLSYDSIHPLLHKNTSILNEQRYTSIFTGSEFFLTDHIINGKSLLPAVCYIEMAIAAYFNSLGYDKGHFASIQLDKIAWTNPFIFEKDPEELNIRIMPVDDNQFNYEIYNFEKISEAQRKIKTYCTGNIMKNISELPAIPDITSIIKRCDGLILSSTDCYDLFSSIDVKYGEQHRCIKELHCGNNEVLAKIELPIPEKNKSDHFILHPGIMDSALQSVIGLLINNDGLLKEGVKPALPFFLDSLSVYEKSPSSGWVFVKCNTGTNESKIKKHDIDICDEKGKICMRLTGLLSRVIDGEKTYYENNQPEDILILNPVLTENNNIEIQNKTYDRHMVVLCEMEEKFKIVIEKNINGVECYNIKSSHENLDKRYEEYALNIFDIVSKLLKEKNGGILMQILISDNNNGHLLSGLSGIIKTANLENPKFYGQLIVIGENENESFVSEILDKNKNSIDIGEIFYKNGRRYLKKWEETILEKTEGILPWKDNGIYLITGGAGGLGFIFAGEIAKKVKQPVLILVGRSKINNDITHKIKELENIEALVEYFAVDVSNYEEVEYLIKNIKNKYGNLNGIIHSAGIIKDNFIIKKTSNEFKEVLSPKVSGLMNLDYSTRDLSPDFFVLFSAGAGVAGNYGQSDYSCANSFMDSYAEYRNNLVKSGMRKGRTLSINWSLWKNGGMHVDKSTELNMKKNLGLIALENNAGIFAFYRSYYSDKDQIMVLNGDTAKLKEKFLSMEIKESLVDKIPIASDVPGNILKEKICRFLSNLISRTLRIDSENIDNYTNLDKYGMDSILVLEINNKLEEKIKDISRTLFFEYNTIDELSDYFIENHKNQMLRLFQCENSISNKQKETIIIKENDKFDRKKYLKDRNDSQNFQQDQREKKVEDKENVRDFLYNCVDENKLFIDDFLKISGVNLDIVRKNNQSSINIPAAITIPEKLPIIIHEDQLKYNPELSKIINDIDKEIQPIGYEYVLYPYYFISSDRKGYIRLIVDESKKIIIPFFMDNENIYRELCHYSEMNRFGLLIISQYREWLDQEKTRIIPMGVWQNIDIEGFTLKGNRMRKLRYLVEKFKNSGNVKVDEYDAEKALPVDEMKRIMLSWVSSKKNVIRHSLDCMKELLEQKLNKNHRAFLTYKNGKLCSIIVIEKFNECDYIMDQEYYDTESSCLGHMEYSITQIINMLALEKANTYSLGLTWYPFVFDDEITKKDLEGWNWLKEQYEKQTLLTNVFNQGKSNYQFKKKFGVTGDPVYAFLDEKEKFSILFHYWPVFLQNSLTDLQVKECLDKITSTEENKLIGSRLADEEKEESQSINLITDSWFGSKSEFVTDRINYYKSKSYDSDNAALKEIFPFKHIILTSQGRTAELLFYKSFSKKNKKILTAIPWTTTIMHQMNNGFDVMEIPDKSAVDFHSDNIFKGELDIDILTGYIKDNDDIALVGLEMLNNATGGHPVRLSHMKKIRDIIEPYDIPLVLDCSRVVRNSLLVKQYESGYSNYDIWDIVKESNAQGDHIVTSLTKDFGVSAGGLIATNDDELMKDIEKSIFLYGQSATDEIREMIIKSLTEKEWLIELISSQLSFTEKLSRMLLELNAPIVKTSLGHCVLIDVSNLMEGNTIAEKKEKFMNRLFKETGIIAGLHQSGKHKNTILDNCIRIAFPLGLNEREKNLICDKLCSKLMRLSVEGNNFEHFPFW